MRCHFSSLPYKKQFPSDQDYKAGGEDNATPTGVGAGCCIGMLLKFNIPAHARALAWRYVELEAAAAELYVSSEMDKAPVCQPIHNQALLLAGPICSLDRCGPADGETEEVVRGSQTASCEAKRDLLFSMELYNALKTLVLHRPIYLHTSVSTQTQDFQQTLWFPILEDWN